MNVTLVSKTKDAEKVCAAAAWNCTHATPRKPASFSSNEAKDLVGRVIDRGHTSIAEHASYTFQIQGISRACSHQLVRNRLASYAQQSQRYVASLQDTVVPDSIKANVEAYAAFDAAQDMVAEVYTELLALGIPAEDARYVLPNAAMTNITVTMNARELAHFFQLRLCKRAQWEIRHLAEYMRSLITGPLFFNAEPQCSTCKDICC